MFEFMIMVRLLNWIAAGTKELILGKKWFKIFA